MMVVLVVTSVPLFAITPALNRALRCALNLVEQADTKGADPKTLEAAEAIRRQLESLFKIDFSSAPRGARLTELLSDLGSQIVVGTQTSHRIHDRHNVVGRLKALSRILFPRTLDAERFTLRAVVAYGVAALKQDSDAGEGKLFLDTARTMDQRAELPESGTARYSLSDSDLIFLDDVARVNLGDRHGGGLRMIRALIHAISDIYEVPQDAK